MDERFPWHVVSDNELMAQVVARGLEMPQAVGAAAGLAVDGTTKSGAEMLFERDIEQFLDPAVVLNTGEQLTIMENFWRRLGYEVPKVADGYADLMEAVEAHPDKRVIPTPLLSLEDRMAVTEAARIFSGQQFSAEHEAIFVAGGTTRTGNSMYSRLLDEPESVVEEQGRSYGLRYKTAGGELVGRQAYIAAMIETGQAIEAEDGTAWVFPVVDARVESDRVYEPGNRLFEQVHPVMTPESLIAIQMLHQAAGTPNMEWSTDVANEAVYELNERGEPKHPVQVASVSWDRSSRQIVLRPQKASVLQFVAGTQPDWMCIPNGGVREAVSGLLSEVAV